MWFRPLSSLNDLFTVFVFLFVIQPVQSVCSSKGTTRKKNEPQQHNGQTRTFKNITIRSMCLKLNAKPLYSRVEPFEYVTWLMIFKCFYSAISWNFVCVLLFLFAHHQPNCSFWLCIFVCSSEPPKQFYRFRNKKIVSMITNASVNREMVVCNVVHIYIPIQWCRYLMRTNSLTLDIQQNPRTRLNSSVGFGGALVNTLLCYQCSHA